MDGVSRWCFKGVEWSKFSVMCESEMEKVNMDVNVDELNCCLCSAIVSAAKQTIRKKEGKKKRKIVPWWGDECTNAIRKRNKAFKALKRNHCFQNYIEYKRKMAIVKRVVKGAKRAYWRGYCDTLGRQTSIGQVWGTIKRMSGNNKSFRYPVMKNGDRVVLDNTSKAELLAKHFVNVHSSENLGIEEKRARKKTMGNNADVTG